MPSRRKQQKDGRRRMHDGRMNEVLDGLLKNIDFLMLTEMDYDDVGVSAPSSGRPVVTASALSSVRLRSAPAPTVVPPYTPNGASTSIEYTKYHDTILGLITFELGRISADYTNITENVTYSTGNYIVPSATYTSIHDVFQLIEDRVKAKTANTADTTTIVEQLNQELAVHLKDALAFTSGFDISLSSDPPNFDTKLNGIIKTALDVIKPDLITALNTYVRSVQTQLTPSTGNTRVQQKAKIKDQYSRLTGKKLPDIIKTELDKVVEQSDLYINLYKLYDNMTYPDGAKRRKADGRKKRSASDGRKKRKAADGRSKRRK